MPDIGPFIRTDYKAVDKRDELRNVLGWMNGDTDKLPVVMDDERPYGLVSDRAMLGRRIDPKAKVESYTLTTRAVRPEATLEEAMTRMAEFRAAHLPVEDDDGKLAGYVSVLDLVREQSPGWRARDVALPVTTLHESQTLSEAHHAFRREYIDHLPVLDGDGRPVGVIARRQLVRMDANQGNKGRRDAGGEKLHPQQAPVEGYLDTRLPMVDADAPLAETLERIEAFGYVLVRERGGQLLGIATAETIAQRAAR